MSHARSGEVAEAGAKRGTVAEPTRTPEAVIERFASLLADGDLDGLVDLYEPDASFVPQPGRTVTGREAIRAALVPFLALRPRMRGDIVRVVRAGETALLANRWTIRGTDPQGGAIEMDGTSADVLRRRPDGSWAIVIDDPWGTQA
jgi:uncharacterized protein (TIGR02246 family)